jgi:hypothetical protein
MLSGTRAQYPASLAIPSKGWRGFPWGMVLVVSGMQIPLFTASLIGDARIARSIALEQAIVAVYCGGFALSILLMFSMAPFRIELRDDGIQAHYWFGSRFAPWARLQPSGRPFSTWGGFTLNESTESGDWHHYILTQEQACAVMRDPRFLRSLEATPRVLASLGLARQDVSAAH